MFKKTDFKLLEHNITLKRDGKPRVNDVNSYELMNATCIDATTEGLVKLIIGTEQGLVLPLKKTKLNNQVVVQGKEFQSNVILGKDTESHHGPIYTVSQHKKNLDLVLTVGDWSAKIWQEETATPI